jgi:PAS domain S-box-containing protein
MDHDDFVSLFELLPIGAYRSTLDGRQVRANPALVRMNGYATEAELLAAVRDIGREWYVERGRRQEFMRLMQRDGQVVDFVSEVHRHHSRERIWVRENAHLVRAGDGEPRYYEGTVEDITPQRNAEAALHASERRFRAFVEKSPVLTVVCDAQARIGYASPATLRLLGVAPSAMVGTNVIEWLHPDDVTLQRREFQRVLEQTNSGEETTCRARHADGSYRHLSLLANNCLADPAVAGIVINAHDVNGRVLAEAALRRLNLELEGRVRQRTDELVQARDAAEYASRTQSERLGRLGQELRAPLEAVLAFAQRLDGAALPPGPLRSLRRAGERLHRQLDAQAALDDAAAPAEIAAVDVAALADACVAGLQPLAQLYGTRLGRAGGEAVHARAGRDRLRLLLCHLVAEAVEAAPGGEVELVATRERDAAALEICPAAATEAGGGSGRRLAERLLGTMGGTIDERVAAGGRRCLMLRLPAQGEATAAFAAAAPQLRAARLLYIEDHAVNLMLMQAMIETQPQLQLLTAVLPEPGLELARRERPDLILLDIRLPGIDGYEVLRRLRADPATAAIPVVAVSADAMPADVQRGLQAGFDDYLTKPVDLGRLLSTLRRLL